MSSLKCPQCGLVNFSTEESCRRCGGSLASAWQLGTGGLASPELTEGFQASAVGSPQPSGPYAASPLAQPGATYTAAQAPPPGAPYAAASTHGGSPYPHYSPPPPPGSYPYPAPPPAKLREGMAISSLVLGCIGFVACGLGGVGSIVGLVLGIVAIVKANKYPSQYGGKGMAIAGIVMNGLFVLFIPIIAAISIPNLLAARMAANEASAIGTLRRIGTAEATYRSMSVGGKQFGSIQQLIDAGLLDSDVANKHGYTFEVRTREYSSASGTVYKFEAVATPVSYGASGRRSFYTSEDNVIRAADKGGREATATDRPLEEVNSFNDRDNEWDDD